MPGLSLSTCHSDADCSSAGRCVKDSSNGQFKCHCAVGYLEPHCRNRDPCLLEGNTICQNGSTCKRISDFEYECKCRVPYIGQFCETYDLCQVDVDECIGDLNKEDPHDPFCYPCVSGATCTQVSKRDYACSCEEGFNHSSCFAFATTPVADPGQHSRSTEHQFKYKNENKNASKIPTVAVTSVCLYFLLLFVVLILLRKRRKYHPKLIVCCDFRKFEDLTYYLISVETGCQWTAGTNGGNAFCFLCGENGQAGPYPLNDLNLSDICALQRCQEDNYLVSHSTNLGCIDKIILCYDSQSQESTWFCDKITVRNIKTEENWLFYVSTWFNSKKHKRRHEFLASTTDYEQEQRTVRINYRYFCHQVARHHTYISPWIYATPDRITLMFVEWMSYMLILTFLYGFIFDSDKDIDCVGTYIFTDNVSKKASWASLCGSSIGLTCTLLLMTCTGVKRIPTLLVWHDKPDMPEYENVAIQNPRVHKENATITNFDKLATIQLENKKLVTKMESGRAVKRMVQQAISGINQHPFRIPDVVKTKKCVDDCAQNSIERARLTDENLHNYYKCDNHQLIIPDKVPTTKIFFYGLSQDGASSSKASADLSWDLSEAGIKRKEVYYELCEMEICRFWNTWRKISVIIGRITCICLIIAATVICCIYGERYGYQRTYDWMVSLAMCWAENFLVFQFLKILLIVVIVTTLTNRKKLPTFEAERQRFQVYYVNGLTVLPDKGALKFVQYPPKYWIPSPHYVKLNYSSTNNSSTSIINSVNDA